MNDQRPDHSSPNWSRRHPKLTLLIVNGLLLLLLLGVAEVVARLVITYNPSYYTSIETTGTELHFPYGTIPINSDGHPDTEFDLSDERPRIAYVGDSVTFGVGAGYGYRFSDILEARHPEYQHMTLASVGAGFRSKEMIERRVAEAQTLGVDLFIYFFNLNDVLPHANGFRNETSREDSGPEDRPHAGKAAAGGTFQDTVQFLRANTQWLRDSSYFFNWLRFRGRVLLAQFGIGNRGLPAYELHPDTYPDVIGSTAERINYLAARLAESGIDFALVVLPYEMQISIDARNTYSSLGIEWDQSFLSGKTSQLLVRNLDDGIPVFHARNAFINGEITPEDIQVGEYFVYDRGDSLDWNHPNRAGHRTIADYLDRVELLKLAPEPEQPGGDADGDGSA